MTLVRDVYWTREKGLNVKKKEMEGGGIREIFLEVETTNKE